MFWLFANLFRTVPELPAPAATVLIPTAPSHPHDAPSPQTAHAIPGRAATDEQTNESPPETHPRERPRPPNVSSGIRSQVPIDGDSFVGLLQRATELYARKRALEEEISSLKPDILWIILCFDRQSAELKRIAAKSDPRLENLTWELEEEIRELQHLLEGEKGLFQKLDSAKARKHLVNLDQGGNLRKIVRSCQQFLDESLSTGEIGKLRVNLKFCNNFWEILEEFFQVEAGKQQRRQAWRKQKDSERRLEKALRSPENNSEDMNRLRQAVADSHIKCTRAQQMDSYRAAILQDQWGRFVKNELVPALSAAGILDTTVVSPSLLPQTSTESEKGLSPISDNHAKSRPPPDQEALLKDFIECSKEYQHHCDELEAFEGNYRGDKISHLCTYTNTTLDSFRLWWENLQGDSYEGFRTLGEDNIRDSRKDLDQAMDRVLAAGLELPAMTGPADEIPNFNETARSKIRKHLRDVARGKSPRRSTPSRISSLGSPVRGSDWASAKSNSGSPGRVAKIRKYEPTIKAMRAEALRERQRKLNEGKIEIVGLGVIEEDEE
ncbi:hypothetical protein PRZ48_002425 [Zasmidium cellare]|uniref:Uncharacterized protein n=1 Tax=Zasmidium cellare TaxID=395010 RepID=A0ABR0F665_ZASCE|nr:hypothetical protein PRZ48_002425 [Zasmidium cellare]